ncbi:MAG: sugar phosphate isomerase/epimerase [Verrucomicrobia bacterium]|nr:sugar phosphate isomerase/epimerase [Verrucomicrobiota bacterium]
MPTITAISSLGWAHYTLYEALPRMAARGFSRAEIASFHSYCFHFNFGSPQPQELKQMLACHGMTPVCLNWSPGSPFAWDEAGAERWVQAFERKIPQAAEAGIPMMTMHFGERNNRPDQDAQLATAVRLYDRVGEFAARHGVRMLLEVPHLYTIHWNVESVLWIFERLSSPNIGALVDSSHWGIIGYDLDSFLGALGKRLWHVHLRDSAGPDTGDRKQQLEMTPGRGRADFRRFGEALDRAGYSGDISIEFEYRDMTFEAIELEYDFGFRHLKDCGWHFPAGVC